MRKKDIETLKMIAVDQAVPEEYGKMLMEMAEEYENEHDHMVAVYEAMRKVFIDED